MIPHAPNKSNRMIAKITIFLRYLRRFIILFPISCSVSQIIELPESIVAEQGKNCPGNTTINSLGFYYFCFTLDGILITFFCYQLHFFGYFSFCFFRVCFTFKRIGACPIIFLLGKRHYS